MPTPKKSRSRARKRKGRVRISKRALMRKKATESAKNDTLQPSPTPRDNGVTFKVKLKRK